MLWPASAERPVVAFGVEGESTDEFAIACDDADIGAGDKQPDLAVLVGDTDSYVAELAEVAECDLAERVDLVPADAVVDGCWLVWARP